MSEEPMALKEAMNLFFSEMCEVLAVDGDPVAILVDNRPIRLTKSKCDLCDTKTYSFKEFGVRYCKGCAPVCKGCYQPCTGGDLDGWCARCIRNNT